MALNDSSTENSTAFPQVQPLDRYNQDLVQNVHPVDWQNPEPEGKYNMVVIGAGTAGLVTFEDILEELVGEIVDEYEPEEPAGLHRIDEQNVEVDARMRVDDLNDELNLDLPEDEDYETIGGFVFSTLGKIPAVGEKCVHDDVSIQVIAAGPRRIDRLRLHLGAADAELVDAGAGLAHRQRDVVDARDEVPLPGVEPLLPPCSRHRPMGRDARCGCVRSSLALPTVALGGARASGLTALPDDLARTNTHRQVVGSRLHQSRVAVLLPKLLRQFAEWLNS